MTGSPSPSRVDSFGGPDNPQIRLLLTLINAAKQRVWIRVPWWDARVAEARSVLDAAIAAKVRGADVRVIVRPDRDCEAAIKLLRDAGVEVKPHRHEHAKELVTESGQFFFSMNLTRKEIQVNFQNGFVTQDPNAVADAAAAFDAYFELSRVTASAGEEVWKPLASAVPESLLPYFEHSELNPLQNKALPVVLDTDRHVLVVAPTGAGKTVIGEAAALRAIKLEGRKAAWLVPARALANELGDLRGRWAPFGISVVSLTGEDNLESPALARADLWVTTTEKFEALYRRGSLRTAIADIGCLVVDEVHLVGDASRGPTLEALLARLRQLPERTRIVALSATATNAPELASWLDADLVQSSWRPTQLTTQIVTYEESEKFYATEEAKDAVLRPIVEDFVAEDEDGQRGSVLVFSGRKKAVRQLAAQLAEVQDLADEEALLAACVVKGVGFQYSGSPRSQAIVDQFRRRELPILVATSGLSTGVNTPARAVIVRDLTLGMDEISVSQVQQMFGRAGRAGHEGHGWAFLVCPSHLAGEWQRRLSDGYNVASHIRDRLPDAVLAEVLLGGIVDVEQAKAWYAGTFAAFLARKEHDEDATESGTELQRALQLLEELDFVRIGDSGALAASDLGALTSRLMVEVAAAASLLQALAAVPIPPTARDAELSILRAVGSSVESLAAPAVNPRDYLGLVDEVLQRAATTMPPEGLPTFGADFTVACALLALEQPRRLAASRSGPSMVPLRATVEQLPRYMAWIAALGKLGLHAWAPAVAGDLSRRLTWWQLTPSPGRGAGRLLWFLEGLIPLGEQRERMQGGWTWAHKQGHRTPDLIAQSPVPIESKDFSRLTAERLSPHLGEISADEGKVLLPVHGAAGARMAAHVGFHGSRTTTVVERQQDGAVELALPRAASGKADVAVDVVWYSSGDAAYQGMVLEVDLPTHESTLDPLEDIRTLAQALPQALTVRSDVGRLQRLFRASKIEDEHLVRLASGSPELCDLARALVGDYGSDHERAHRLRERLPKLLRDDPSDGAERPPTEVLRTLRATENELGLCLAALAASAGLSSGLARGATAGRIYPLVRVADRWYVLYGLAPGLNVSLKTISPQGLGSQLLVLPVPVERPAPVQPTSTHLDFLTEFLPTA